MTKVVMPVLDCWALPSRRRTCTCRRPTSRLGACVHARASPRSAAAGTGSLMHADLQQRCRARRPATKRPVLCVNPIQELGNTVHRLLIALPIRSTYAQHQLIRALTHLLALQESRAQAPQAELRARGLCDGLHVLPVGTEDPAGDLELRFLLNTDEELALRLRNPGSHTATAIDLLRPARSLCAAAVPRLLVRPPAALGLVPPLIARPRLPPCGSLGSPLELVMLLHPPILVFLGCFCLASLVPGLRRRKFL
mmetsp:Transcript_82359/g.223632  ORF Transcript_82359/g.223632 Transcript_82359/m.223632 type:complete len:253 (-) Transcript_82359:178-936(-)